MSAAKKLDTIDPVIEISSFMQTVTGVQLGGKQYEMVSSRLQRRSGELGLPDLFAYLDYFKSNRSQEEKKLISLLTTHHTYFLREFSHFEALDSHVLEDCFKSILASKQKRPLRIWSAACSRGQEVYSLAMWIRSYLGKHPEFSTLGFKIFGTDIDPESVQFASNGVYPWKEVQEVPMSLMTGNWARGTGDIANFVKASKTMRDQVEFAPFNLFEGEYKPKEKFDIIFCRNVFIYFNAEQIKKLTLNFHNKLEQHGFMFLGISESIQGMNLPFNLTGASIYTRKDKVSISSKNSSVAPGNSVQVLVPKTAAKLKVLCVDDSKSIHTLLDKVLTADKGFEIIGHAYNGKEAQELMKTLKPDLMTLDIHMPEMTGDEYLARNFNSSHPPVVILSSVSREDSALGLKVLQLGATDFIEKPTLSNLQEVGDQLTSKLKLAAFNKANVGKKLNIDKAFAAQLGSVSSHKIPSTIRVISFTLGDRQRVAEFLKTTKIKATKTVFVVNDFKGGEEMLVQELNKFFPLKKEEILIPSGIIDQSRFSGCEQVQFVVFAKFPKNFEIKQPNLLTIVEEEFNKDLPFWVNKSKTELVPFTSFAYVADKQAWTMK